MSTATDGELTARGERFERLLLEHIDAWLAWAPRMRAALAEAKDSAASLAVAVQRNGCDVQQARMSEIERDMQPLAEEIIAAPATSFGGLRAKALVALWEALPAYASHAGAFDFPDASRSLFDAVAEMTGLMPIVRVKFSGTTGYRLPDYCYPSGPDPLVDLVGHVYSNGRRADRPR